MVGVLKGSWERGLKYGWKISNRFKKGGKINTDRINS